MDFSTRHNQTPKRFCAVNAVRLREFRLACGWSQAELARRSGYTSRLIRKAESGGSLNYETIADLAETFTSFGTAVRAEEFLLDPVAIVKEFIEAYERTGAGCIQPLAHYFSPSIHSGIGCMFNGIGTTSTGVPLKKERTTNPAPGSASDISNCACQPSTEFVSVTTRLPISKRT